MDLAFHCAEWCLLHLDLKRLKDVQNIPKSHVKLSCCSWWIYRKYPELLACLSSVKGSLDMKGRQKRKSKRAWKIGECGRLESRSWDDIRAMIIKKKCFNSSILFGFPLTESSNDLNHCLVMRITQHSSCGLVSRRQWLTWRGRERSWWGLTSEFVFIVC